MEEGTPGEAKRKFPAGLSCLHSWEGSLHISTNNLFLAPAILKREAEGSRMNWEFLLVDANYYISMDKQQCLSRCGSAEKNLIEIREDASSIPSLPRWVKDPTLL